MNLLLLKQLSILGAFVGGIFGLFALFTPLTLFMIILSFGLPAVIILVYMKNNNLIGIMNTRDGAIWGAVIGVVTFIAQFVVFAPLSILVSVLFSLFAKQTYVAGFLRMIPFDFGSIFVLVMCVLFLSGISALFNGFFGAVTAYVYEMITGIKKGNDENTSIDFEIK